MKPQPTDEELQNGFSSLPEDGNHVTREEFRDGVRSGQFSQENVRAYYATATAISPLEASINNYKECNGEDKELLYKFIPELFTHVIWFPKV